MVECIRLGPTRISNITRIGTESLWDAENNKLDVSCFSKSLIVKIIRISFETIELDIVGIDPSLANAMRRIMMAEVPTMAIEKMYVLNNTSIIADEILAHRLGLVPIFADPKWFETKQESDDCNDKNTIVFRLQARCDGRVPLTVYSNALVWIPQGDQVHAFQKAPIRPVSDDIVLAKLAPGQEISLELHCEKNIGKEHAKWSPVCTAWYRLLPQIQIKEPVTGKDAHKLALCFPKGVISIEQVSGVDTAVVSDPRYDTMSREYQRHSEFADKVTVSRCRNHYIFAVESTGVMSTQDIVDEALSVLIEKCNALEQFLDEIAAPI